MVSQAAYRQARTRAARLWLRFCTYGVYPWQVLGRFAGARPDMVGVLSSTTFYAPWLAMLVAPRKVPLVHWVLDLYPDALEVAGKLDRAGVPARLLRSLMRATFQRAAANVFLGTHLLRHAERSMGAIPRAQVIPVGADGGPFRATPPLPRGKPVRVLYCGNLGQMHDTETVFAVLAAGLPDGVEVSFCGNGAGFDALAARLAGTGRKVSFSGNLPDAQWASAMREADVALVTLRRGAEQVVMPSKAYSAMMAGQAVLAIGVAESDLAELVRTHDAGWLVEPGDATGLRRVLERIAEVPDEVLAKRRNAWQAGHRFYDQSVVSRRWADLFEQVTTPRTNKAR